MSKLPRGRNDDAKGTKKTKVEVKNEYQSDQIKAKDKQLAERQHVKDEAIAASEINKSLKTQKKL